MQVSLRSTRPEAAGDFVANDSVWLTNCLEGSRPPDGLWIFRFFGQGTPATMGVFKGTIELLGELKAWIT